MGFRADSHVFMRPCPGAPGLRLRHRLGGGIGARAVECGRDVRFQRTLLMLQGSERLLRWEMGRRRQERFGSRWVFFSC